MLFPKQSINSQQNREVNTGKNTGKYIDLVYYQGYLILMAQQEKLIVSEQKGAPKISINNFHLLNLLTIKYVPGIQQILV